MLSIWDFIFRTLDASCVAVILLIAKRLLSDKLSPKWQYGIWGVLALRILLPFSFNSSVFPFPIFLETVKGFCEAKLNSAFCNLYTASSTKLFLPIINQNPISVTDWLFVIYTLGIVLTLLRYLFSYIRLRLILKKGAAASAEAKEIINGVCTKYSLKGCRAVQVKGLKSAFICGVIRPVLALPADAETDEKVILHELLHRKNFDALQNIFWCVLKALHWCNPFMQYIFSRINNDMEALCDQRALELLEGEERREYGAILLEMANDKYAHAIGTTSISNGGKNISRRIEAIVRFKKYPKGMGLVSICIALIIACPMLFGGLGTASAGEYDFEDTKWLGIDICKADKIDITDYKLQRAMALSRAKRCTTLGGAVDTYAKGVMFDNIIYQAIASPAEKQEEMFKSIADGAFENPLEGCFNKELPYLLYNFKKNADGKYSGILALPTYNIIDKSGKSPINWEEALLDYSFYDMGGELHGPKNPCDGWYLIVPISIYRENGWVVEETGEREAAFLGTNEATDDTILENVIEPLSVSEKTTDKGKLTLKTYSIMAVKNAEAMEIKPEAGKLFQSTTIVFPSTVYDCSMNSTLKTDAQFYVREVTTIGYLENRDGKEEQRLVDNSQTYFNYEKPEKITALTDFDNNKFNMEDAK